MRAIAWPRHRALRIVVALIAVLVAVYLAPARGSSVAVERAFADGASGVMVEFASQVERLLPDDDDGSRHQRFVVRLSTGHTVLVSHNIDLAERVPVAVGDDLEIRGQYEWNGEGGVVHWTHHDPGGSRPGGWIRFQGRDYR